MTTDSDKLRTLAKWFDTQFKYDQTNNEVQKYLIQIADKLEAKDKECAAKIAAGERLRMEDAMSAINEANGLREKIKEQELIIYGIEEGAEQWKSLCADKDKEIAVIKFEKDSAVNSYLDQRGLNQSLAKQITDLKAEIERMKGDEMLYEKALIVIQSHEFKKREAYQKGLEAPCPSCGGTTDDYGDCRKCGVVYLNGVHSINNCKEYHTHGNECYTPFLNTNNQ